MLQPVLPQRPKIELLVENLRAGESCTLRVLLDSAREIRARAVQVDIECVLTLAPGQERRFLVDQLSTTEVELLLPVGKSMAVLTWWIPAGLAASDARVRYVAHVTVDVPWWPDASMAVDLTLLPGEPPQLPAAQLVRLSVVGSEQQRIGFEGTFESRMLRVGSNARLRVAFASGHGRGRLRAELRCLLVQHVPGQSASSAQLASYEYEQEILDGRPGSPVELLMPIPEGALPGFSGRLASVTWSLHVHARLGGSRWTWEGTRPIVLVPANTPMPADDAPLAAPALPAIGDERFRRTWRVAATEQALAYDGTRLIGQVAGAALRLERSFREGTWWLLGTLEYASLDLGLTIMRADVDRLPRQRRIRLGDADWDQRQRVEAHDDEQALGFLVQARAALTRLSIESLDDTSARVWRVDGESERSDVVRWFAAELVALARAIADARTCIQPPAPMRAALPAWQQLAERLEGSLRVATMCIDGSYAGVPASVHTTWTDDRQPRATRVLLWPPLPLSPPDDATLAGLWRDSPPVQVTGKLLSADLPAPLVDTDEALALLGRLLRLYQALRAQASGAYR